MRARAAERMKDTARAAARFGVQVVTGFTGSPVWHMLYSFPPNDFAEIERGYERFAEAWGPIIDVFDAEGVRFALEVHPTEIAYDFVTTRKALAAIGHRPASGSTSTRATSSRSCSTRPRSWTSSPPTSTTCTSRTRAARLDGRSSILGSHLNFGEPGRGWDFVSPGHGDVDFEELFRAQPRGLRGPALDRVGGLGDGPRVRRPRRPGVRPRTDFPPSGVAFDAAFARED